SAFVTSSVRVSMPGTSLFSASSRPALMSVATTRAPSRANAVATARPMPWPAAVTKAVLPASLAVMVSPRGKGRRSARNQLGARELLLCLDQRGHVLAPVAQRAGERQRLVHRLAHHAGDRQPFGQVGVVAHVLARQVELELEPVHLAAERL